MTISLRAHHLLCMLTYLGKGYTPGFVSNYSKIIKSLNDGAVISLVFGPDDICQPMLNEETCHCHNESVHSRDQEALVEIGHVLNRQLTIGDCVRLDGHDLQNMRDAFKAGAIRSACDACEWHGLCSDIALNEFRGCRLQLPLQKNSI